MLKIENARLLDSDDITEAGQLLLEFDLYRNTLIMSLLLGYARRNEQLNVLENCFKDNLHLNEDMIEEELRDSCYKPAYVRLGMILIDGDAFEQTNDMNACFLHKDLDIKYLTYCLDYFKNGSFTNSQLKVTELYRSSSSSYLYYTLDTDISVQDLKLFTQKAKLMDIIPKNFMYLSKQDLLTIIQRAYKKREKELLLKQATLKKGIDFTTETTTFEKYHVYGRQARNSKIYVYVCLGKGKDGNDYFLRLYSDTDKERVLKFLMKTEKVITWLQSAIKTQDAKTLSVKLYDMNCVLKEPTANDMTYVQRWKLKDLGLC